MREGAATLSEDGLILYCNKRLADLLGMPTTRLTGANLLDHVAVEDSYIAEALIKRGMRRESQGEVALVGRSGESTPTQLLAFPVDLDGLQVVALLFTDLTEVNRYRYDLEELISARTVDLAEANERLKDEAQARHELDLQVFEELDAGLLQVKSALDDAVTGNDTEQRDELRRTLRTLTGLLDDVRMLAELESGKSRMEYRHVSLRDVALAAAESVRAAANEKNVDVVVDLPAEELSFFTDQRKLSSALLSLLAAAVEVSAPESRVRLLGSAGSDLRAVFEVRCSPGGAYGELSITNEKDLFDALRGTTLGLSIRRAWRITALLSGLLSVRREGEEVVLRLEIAL